MVLNISKSVCYQDSIGYQSIWCFFVVYLEIKEYIASAKDSADLINDFIAKLEIFKRKWKCLTLNMDKFRLDRTAFKGQTAREASDHRVYYSKLDWKERLKVAYYLNSIAFNFPFDNPPRMDKSKFSASTRS